MSLLAVAPLLPSLEPQGTGSLLIGEPDGDRLSSTLGSPPVGVCAPARYSSASSHFDSPPGCSGPARAYRHLKVGPTVGAPSRLPSSNMRIAGRAFIVCLFSRRLIKSRRFGPQILCSRHVCLFARLFLIMYSVEGAAGQATRRS
jgi:hypothetical protein